MLNCEKNTPSMGRRVARAARKARLGPKLVADFEHGQWWITSLTNGGQWSAVDSCGMEGIHTFDGFCFEEVTAPEE